MAISLTTEGLRVDYRTESQTSVSGTYPIGTVIVANAGLSLPGTWVITYSDYYPRIGSMTIDIAFAIRIA